MILTISSDRDRSPNNFSWQTIGQNIVDTVGRVLKIEIAILHLNNWTLPTEKYFIYQQFASRIDKRQKALLKQTVRPTVEFQTTKDLIISSYRAKATKRPHSVERACLAAQIFHSIAIPLFNEQNLVASLTLHRCQPQFWQDEEIELARIMAAQASSLVSQVLNCDRASALARRETTINRITATIRSSLEPHVMFAAIVKELGQALNVDGCTLSLWTKHDRFVRCVGLYNPHETENDCGSYQQADKSVVPIAENPILQKLLQTKQPVLSEDLEQQQNIARHELPWHAKARALLVVPLIVEGEIIGSITLRQSDSRSWSSSEIELAKAVASQAALAISQVLAYERVKTLAQRETTINRITATIRYSLEPQIMFAAIAKELGQALNVDGCTLSLWTKHDHFVECVGLYNPHEAEETQPNDIAKQQATKSLVPISENPILQALLSTKKPVLSEDLERQKNLARYELPWHAKARALLIVPLIVEGEIIGSITLRQSTTRTWSNSEIELAEAVASQAAIAVQQAKLYETTRQQAEKLRIKEQKVKNLNNYLTESILKRFLPEAIANKAAKGELALDLHPEPHRITVLFCDLVGFTNLSSQLGTRLLAQLLNEYLEAMNQAVFDHEGTVDKYTGDGLMAIFGAPEHLSRLEQAQKAIATAKTMYFYLKQLNQKWQTSKIGAEKMPILQMRCGIHQGKAIVGMFGGKQRKDYTAIGRVVNIAARLEQIATPNTIAISQTLADCLKDLQIQQIEIIKLKGIERDFRIITIAID
ncbi:GAF domain-containing protein [Myxosarcina sp. GI1]|uniref:GAF domain-containing protein n=1 Tax=Myxosarcina sp. GI1 TaxID=1541065 RepID=UPI0009DDC49A|nr:GAF domain-containing protein [Myxosarcina sp. GI1]